MYLSRFKPAIREPDVQKHFLLDKSSRRWRRLRVYPVLALWLSVYGVAACRSPASAGPPPQAG